MAKRGRKPDLTKPLKRRPWKPKIDKGTPEQQERRLALVGPAADPALAQSIQGIIYARHFIDKAGYEALNRLASLAWSNGKPFAKGISLEQYMKRPVDIEEITREELTEEDKEERDARRERNLTRAIRALDDVGRDAATGVWWAIVCQSPPPWLAYVVENNLFGLLRPRFLGLPPEHRRPFIAFESGVVEMIFHFRTDHLSEAEENGDDRDQQRRGWRKSHINLSNRA